MTSYSINLLLMNELLSSESYLHILQVVMSGKTLARCKVVKINL